MQQDVTYGTRRPRNEDGSRIYPPIIKKEPKRYVTEGDAKYIFDDDLSHYKYHGADSTLIDENMKALAHLILDLKKDVRKVRDAQTYNGALEYVNKHNKNKDARYHWSVKQEDINDDGIPDIIIRDQHKRAKFVNGWTVKKQDPYQTAYTEYLQYNYGNPAQRRRHVADGNKIKSFNEWLDSELRTVKYEKPFDDPIVEYNSAYDDFRAAVKRANDNYYRDTGVMNIYKLHSTPRRRSANAVFTSLLVKDAYKTFVDKYEGNSEYQGRIRGYCPILQLSAALYKLMVIPKVEELLKTCKSN
ncbi:hypothetical protein GPJ56_005566 [Histomonas meleagridis]|nr:hypothetical protein GPJ56_005566 [Histomonas meleagridis]